MEPPTGFTPLIAIHAIAASYVLLLGPVNLLRRRRDRAHRLIGFGWTVMMLITCLSSFGIVRGGFSWLHALSLFTLYSVSAGVWAISRGNRFAHRFNMTGSYLGTATAFGFAILMPDRLLPQLALNNPLGLALTGTLVLATAVSFTLLATGSASRQGVKPSTAGLKQANPPGSLQSLDE